MTVTAGTIVVAFLVLALAWLLLAPALRSWPADKPEAKRLRRLENAGEFVRLFIDVSKTMPSLRKIPKEDRISPQLSEKIMLAVCGVNECSHCSYLHTKTALEKDVPEDQIRDLLAGQFGNAAGDELPALLFAQHYAESRGAVSREAEESVTTAYGSAKVSHIKAYLLTVNFGNLCCNTVEYYEHGNPDRLERRRMYLAYLLAKPVQWFIARGATEPDV